MNFYFYPYFNFKFNFQTFLIILFTAGGSINLKKLFIKYPKLNNLKIVKFIKMKKQGESS
jgi:hypothetical protein